MAKKRKHNVPDGRASHGGPRKGGGRPAGAATRLARYKPQELVDKNESPLDVMVDNMLFWFRSVKSIEKSLESVVSNLDASDPDQRADFLKLLKQFMAARENAQKCAVDAAPYVHPRLAAIKIDGNVKVDAATILGTMTPMEAGQAYANTMKMGNQGG